MNAHEQLRTSGIYVMYQKVSSSTTVDLLIRRACVLIRPSPSHHLLNRISIHGSSSKLLSAQSEDLNLYEATERTIDTVYPHFWSATFTARFSAPNLVRPFGASQHRSAICSRGSRLVVSSGTHATFPTSRLPSCPWLSFPHAGERERQKEHSLHIDEI